MLMSANSPVSAARVVIIGAGPAGLMAAEVLACAGVSVDIYDAMPSAGRKFLLAGKGGMNLTHSEPFAPFLARYGDRAERLHDMIAGFDNQAVCRWADGLGVATFTGSSGRIFPVDMKAAPLLRAWLHRLREHGVRFHMRHRWTGWSDDQQSLRFQTPDGEHMVSADTVLLALGGASWPRLGSDAAWVPLLSARGVTVQSLYPANCGFERPWSDTFRNRFAGAPLLTVAARVAGSAEAPRRGQFVMTEHGVEGSLIYALSSALRRQLLAQGEAVLELDLLPDFSNDKVRSLLESGRGAKSMSSFLQSRLGLDKLKLGLLHECLSREQMLDTAQLAAALKALPLRLHGMRPVEEAISTAGGVCFDALDQHLMLNAIPGMFCAGEMLDWEAPTGGYLLTACLATGRQAGLGMLAYLQQQNAC
ncbi:NAD(P)/FAD-dependent oxidoreductase [Undibacterium squillarum]|uniref:NAD(FAD)-utilizing dehydrogenase n=1 Tax=Undibacterium squillarum TaxID=1131567 RepID=A0ABQ2XWQ2_9BURK|nr:TIGR03862 family flavoprotein [Undibacterium squillarum]GGX38331.1 NAD(FAD)-utilizing dehydrogenase [Undibacterium squillarum]